MANEHWEEISEWDIEEDIDLAQRITVHSVHSIDDEEEFQFIQAHKNPTYAAAAKWGDRKSSSNDDKANITSKISSASTSPKGTKGNKEKKSSSTSPKGAKDDKEKKSSSTSPKGTKDDKEKKSSSSKDVKNDEPENDILKGDHDVEYETNVPSSKDWKETRRSNTKLHKIHSQKLMSSLISDAELELNQDLVKGDTNRDPEFKRYKLLKKSMAISKKYSDKSKSDRKNLERVEVW